ncbi:hypothetical protein NV226_02990 [Mycoplasma iguanae]|uniref:DUF4231 domain-containing protein n=1 Tax=Mycoplasma iguanae TaxID=292461 RepID=A0ABY5R9K3_9MOLU|nr:hypothetical protein [Mycoplasma iguanae]UVD81665.1 hypothetical protein NV226_02990 [Mycoplasma iguanae]
MKDKKNKKEKNDLNLEIVNKIDIDDLYTFFKPLPDDKTPKIYLDPKKKVFAKDKLKNIKSQKETLEKATKAWKHYKKKYWRSYGLFVSMNVLIIIISTLMIILNLYSLRWNTSKEQYMIWFFIAIAIGSLIITLLTSISAFMSFSTKNEIYLNNIRFLKKKLEQYKHEPIEDLHSFISEVGAVDTDF